MTNLVACGAASRLRLKPIIAAGIIAFFVVACGAASRLRLKRTKATSARIHHAARRMWSGFSSEIETERLVKIRENFGVACGAASRLRLKLPLCFPFPLEVL